jgi:16S rRNA (guanine1207-N2)-methyltransferase
VGTAAGQYFDPDPSSPSKPRTVDLHLPDVNLRLTTDSGVFAADGVDPGTKHLLLDAAVSPEGGTLLDLGCGYGAIALTLARRAPSATVWATDVNTRALRLCEANAVANGITNVRVAEPAAVPVDVAFDEIWSNPPIRIGKSALHELLSTWLPRLVPGGVAWLVVQKHLGSDSLARWLQDAGWPTERVSSRGGYRVLKVSGA